MPAANWAGVRGVLTDIDDTLTRDGAIEPQALSALQALADAGVPVIAVTGRPMGWSEPFARTWPVCGIVAENGSVALFMEGGSLQVEFAQDAATRAANAKRLQQAARAILLAVPGASLARDSVGRATDIAIDHGEFAHLGPDKIAEVVRLMEAAGMCASVSSIHVNGWFGRHDKLSGARWAVRRLLGRDLDAELDDWVYVGDSPNDEVMFATFRKSVGVSNLLDFADRLCVWPAYLTSGARGLGFAELARTLLGARGHDIQVLLPDRKRQSRPSSHRRGVTAAAMKPIGTPLSPHATRVMLLGAGELGKEVLIALQRLGVETIAVDRYADAPGQQVAHHARTIAMSDADALRALIEAEKPDWVVPEIEAIATPVLQALEAAGTVRVVPTARAARLTMDREGIRRLAAETLGLPTSPYRFCDSQAELQAAIDDAIGYPCIVKPVMSSSGKGQSRIDGPADVAKAWDHAMAGGRVSHGRVIVEGFIDFDYEITLLTVRAADGTHYCEPIGHRQVGGDYVESWQPHPMRPAALARAKEIAGAITADLGGQGVFGVELFVKGDQVWFSEVSPRPHDTGMVTMATQWQSEFELHARAILGLPVDVSLKSAGASAVIYGGVDARGIVFDGVAEALAVPGSDIRLFGKPESFVKRRMGVALVHADDVDTARARASQAAAAVRPRRA